MDEARAGVGREHRRAAEPNPSTPSAAANATATAAGLLALATACALFVATLYLVFVRTETGQRVDDAPASGRVAFMRVDLGDGLMQTVAVASVVLLGGAILFAAVVRKQPGLAMAAAAVIAGANVTTQVLKAALERPGLLRLGEGNTFPSGHATLAMSLALVALLVVPISVRGVVALVGALFAASVGVALTSGFHRPSDVVAGFAVAVAWAASVAWARKGELLSSGGPTRVASVLVATGGALFALTFAGVIVLAIARRRGPLGAVHHGAAYAGSVVAIAGSALLLVGLLLVALSRRTDELAAAAAERRRRDRERKR